MLGFCSWSLRPSSPSDLVAQSSEVGLGAVQLSLKPLRLRPFGQGWSTKGLRRALVGAGLSARSGMFGLPGERADDPAAFAASAGLRGPAPWKVQRRHLRRFARLAARLELPLLSWHAGLANGDAVFLDRLGETAEIFARHGVALALETGQESPEDLRDALFAVGAANLGVNFDPANFVLHATGEPLEALEVLAGRVLQVHVKDARPPERAGGWGREVALGDGVVPWSALLAALAERAPEVDLMIEREFGDDRVGDLRRAHSLLSSGSSSR